jgi:uncharacterized protein (DUF433 family)
MDNQVLIYSDSSVMMGKPVVAGTHITVELILEKLAAGETQEQILAAHPRLTVAAISADLAFAKESIPSILRWLNSNDYPILLNQ